MYKRTVYLLLIALALVVTSCTGPLPVQPTNDPNPIYTQAAQTLVAALTQAAGGGQPVQFTPTGMIISPGTDTPPPAQATNTPAFTAAPAGTDTPAPTGTTAPTNTSEPSPTVQSTPTSTRSPGTVIFEDDFSTAVGWYEDEGTNWVFEFLNGQYRITNNIPGAVLWSVREVPYNNVRVEVDGSRSAGPSNGFYGITCRYEDGENYYAMGVASNGFYVILRRRDNSQTFLVSGTDVSGAIRPGSETNRVRGDCLGNALTLYVNGQKLAEATDDYFEEGWIGMIVGNRIEAGTQVTFDNFVVIRP